MDVAAKLPHAASMSTDETSSPHLEPAAFAGHLLFSWIVASLVLKLRPGSSMSMMTDVSHELTQKPLPSVVLSAPGTSMQSLAVRQQSSDAFLAGLVSYRAIFGEKVYDEWLSAKLQPVVLAAITEFEARNAYAPVAQTKRRRADSEHDAHPQAAKKAAKKQKAPETATTDALRKTQSSASSSSVASSSLSAASSTLSSTLSTDTAATSLPSSPVLLAANDPSAAHAGLKAEPAEAPLALNTVLPSSRPASTSSQAFSRGVIKGEAGMLLPPAFPFFPNGSAFLVNPKSPGGISPLTVSAAVFARSPPRCWRCQSECKHNR